MGNTRQPIASMTFDFCYPDRKVHGANMRPTWILSAPDGPLVIRVVIPCNHLQLDVLVQIQYLVMCAISMWESKIVTPLKYILGSLFVYSMNIYIFTILTYCDTDF